jgi:hypothetical protein
MPFLAAAFAAISTFAASSVLAGFVVNLGASLLLSTAAAALTRKNVDTGTMKGRTVTSRQPIAPHKIIYGEAVVGGTIVFLNTRDAGGITDQALDMVIALAAHPVEMIGSVYLNGELAIDFDGNVVGRYVGWLSYEKHTGTGTGGAFASLRAASPELWTTAHKLQNRAAIFLNFGFNPDIYPNGIPNVSVYVKGKKDILDPRTGSRSYKTNPALCLADYMADPIYGLGAEIGAADGINEADLIEAANVCDETVAKVGGGTERRYTCNGLIDTSVAPQEVIEGLLTAMAGTCGWQAGQWHIYAGAYRTPTLALTADDCTEAGLSVATRISRAQNFNAVRGTFVSPDNDWVADDFPAYQSAAYITEDGGDVVWRDITLPFTISASMAQRLAKIELERNRRQMTVQIDGKLRAWLATVGDTVTLDYARWGFSAKPFDVAAVNLQLSSGEAGAVIAPQLTLRETSPLVYDWASSEFQIYAAAPRTTLPNAFKVTPPGSPTAAESLYLTRDGAGVKTQVALTWPRSTSPYVDQYIIDARVNGGAWVRQGRTENLSFTLLDWTPGQWEFRVKAISRLGVSSAFASCALEVSGLGALPAAITGLTLQTAGGLAVLKWTLHPDLDVRYGGTIIIRHSAASSPSFANAVSMDEVPGSTAIAVVPLKPGAYVLRARDSGDNYGPSVVISTSGATAIGYTGIATLQEDATFTGAKSGVTLVGSTLKLDSSGQIDTWADVDAVADIDFEGGILPTGTYTFATGINAGLVKRMRLRSVIDMVSDNVFDQIDTRTGNIDDWLSFDGVDGGEVDVEVEFRTTQTSPAGSPVWSDWGRVENTETSAWGVQARAILTSNDASFTPVVSQLRLVADEVI